MPPPPSRRPVTVGKRPRSRRGLEVALIVGVAGLAAAWWWQSNRAAKPSDRAVPVATKTTPAEVADAPAEAPIPAPPPAPRPARPPALVTDARAELSTAIPDMIQVLGNQGAVGFMKSLMTPEELAAMPPNAMDQIASDPEMAKKTQNLMTLLQTIQTFSPTMDATGERATYTLTPQLAALADGETSITFVKRNGRWGPN